MRNSMLLLCTLFVMISITENKDVRRKATEEHLVEVRMMIEDTKEKLKTSATSNNRNGTQISYYKELLIKLIEEMNDIQHEISQKRKEDNEPHKISSLMQTNISQDLLNKSLDENPMNEKVFSKTEKLCDNRLDRCTAERKIEYANQSHRAYTVQDLLNESVEGKLYNETNVIKTKKTRENNLDYREKVDTSANLFGHLKTSEYLHGRPERRPVLVRVHKTSTQKSYEVYNQHGRLVMEEESDLDKKQINVDKIDRRTTKSKETKHRFMSKLRSRLQYLENLFHDFFIHEYTPHTSSKHSIKHTKLPKISKIDLKENDKTWYGQEKDNGSSEYSYYNHYMHTNRKPTRNKCLTLNRPSNDLQSMKRKHVGISDANYHNLEDFSDVKEFDEKSEKENCNFGRRVGDKHKDIENKVHMPLYSTRYNVDSFNKSHQCHREKDIHEKIENFKRVSDINNEHVNSNEELSNHENSNSENHLNDESSDLHFLLEEVDDTNYGGYSTKTESKRKRTKNSNEKESNVFGKSTLISLKKNLFYRGKSPSHLKEKIAKANMSKVTEKSQSVTPEMTKEKAQSSTRVVITIFAKPLLRNVETEVFKKTPQNTALAIGLAILCLLTFLSILAAVQFTANFLVNDPRAKNIFLFHGK